MRILIAHSRYASGDLSGENRVVQDEGRLLEDGGHEVLRWTPESWPQSKADLAALGMKAIWASTFRRFMDDVQRDFRPDVVHFHNLFPQLSPAALRAAAGRAAVVMTLHNYRLICPAATFVLRAQTCERCLGTLPWRAVVHGCYRQSRLGSASLAASLSLHRALRTFAGSVDTFFAVSQFVKEKHVEAGFDPERIVVKPNFVMPAPRRDGAGESFLYIGRLSPEKGLDALLQHWHDVDARLVVAGDGPDAQRLRAMAPPTVEFLGAVDAARVPELLARARAVVVPSRAFEGAPRVVVEAYAVGVPVLAARSGALPELVVDGEAGLLLEPGDAQAWKQAVARLSDDEVAERMGAAAYEIWRRLYSPEVAFETLEAGYAAAITARERSGRNRSSGATVATGR
jgi:glycosyltransferase involved in cell wall biosynthesis